MQKRPLNLKEKIKISSLSALGFSFIWVLDKSYRVEKINFNPAQSSVIYAVWHGWQYGLLDIHPRENLHLLVSQSNDGEIIGKISKMLGYSLIRGSRGRGGTEALRKILKVLNEGKNIAYTVDGPRGPIHKVKDGIIKIAQMSQAPVIPLVPAAKWKTGAKSWDKYQIPHLFTKIITVFGDPIYIPKNISEEQGETYRLNLENELFRLKNTAEELLRKA